MKGELKIQGIKKYGRKVYFDFEAKDEDQLTEDEMYLLKYFMKMKHLGRMDITIIPISRRYQLDFVGWERYRDVLIVN